jgi:hypothetical protein
MSYPGQVNYNNKEAFIFKIIHCLCIFFFWVRKVISMSQLAVFLAIEKSVAILASYMHAICHFICLVVEIYMQRMTSS